MHEFDMAEKIYLLKNWCEKHHVDTKKIENVFAMLKRGKRPEWTSCDPMQYPSCYIFDANAKPWHKAEEYLWTKLLEDNAVLIRQEAQAIFGVGKAKIGIHPDNDNLAHNGTWNTFFFYKNGERYEENHIRCPVTSHILGQIPGVEIAGRTYFSAMTPGIHIKPHCGPHNFKLRTHLGLVIPVGATIRVGEIERPWEENKCLVFDDSFCHEIWNNGQAMRIVLIVDVWNPSLSPIEISALEYIMPEFYLRKAVQNA